MRRPITLQYAKSRKISWLTLNDSPKRLLVNITGINIGTIKWSTKHPSPIATGQVNFNKQVAIIIGFENHGGRTFLGKGVKPFGHVLKGFGNNGIDKTEGAIYENSIGTYLHGPILPKNPEIADWLIQKALEKKYNKKIKLEKLNDSLSKKAKKSVLQKMSSY